MKRTTLLLKSLLLAVGLLAGSNVWAQTTAFSQDFTAIEESTAPADYGFALSYGAGSDATLVDFSVTGGVLQCVAGPYASSSAGNRTGAATASFSSIGTGNEITVSYTWALGSATGNASGSWTKTRVGNASGNALEIAFYGSDGGGAKLTVNGTPIFQNNAIRSTTYTVTATLNMNDQVITALTLTCSNKNYSYTASEYIDFASNITSVDRFVFENSERQSWANTSSVDNVSITYVEAKELVNSIAVNYTFDGEIIYTDNISAVGLYCGDSYQIPFRKYIVKDGELYTVANNASNAYYGQTVNLVANTVVTKNASKVDIGNGAIAFFNDFDGSTGNNADIRASYMGSYDNKAFTSEEILPAGVYTFMVRAYSRNRGSSVNVGETQVFKIADVGGSWQDKTFADVSVPTAGKLSFVAGGSKTYDPIDVIIAICKDVSVTIGESGWATLYSPFALDFAKIEGLSAYTATVDGTTVTLNDVSSVPANTGVVLKGAAGTYNIPVIPSSDTTEKGDLKGNATAATTYDADYSRYYLAMNTEDKAQFKKLNEDGSIAAGKAYLEIDPTVTARALSVVFAGETTAIDAIANVKEQNGEVYNLAGQRVAKPAKGLYIVSGKKVMFK